MWEKKLLAAQGYTELGMFEDALTELDAIEPERQEHPETLVGRLHVLMQARMWAPALDCAQRLARSAPDRSIGFIHTAFCLHEMGRTTEARDSLLSGPDFLQEEPTYHYNLSCYEAVLGNLDTARAHLKRSFELDKNFRELAKVDPDLAALKGKV